MAFLRDLLARLLPPTGAAAPEDDPFALRLQGAAQALHRPTAPGALFRNRPRPRAAGAPS